MVNKTIDALTAFPGVVDQTQQFEIQEAGGGPGTSWKIALSAMLNALTAGQVETALTFTPLDAAAASFAGSAAKLTTARNIAITGDLAWNVNFDGSGNVTAAGALAATAVAAGSYGDATHVASFTVDAKGRLTGASNVPISGVAASGPITTSGLTIATARLAGRTTAGTGAIEEIQAGAGLDLAAGVLKAKTQVTSAASSASPFAWNSDALQLFAFTALANALTINADSGTPSDGQKVTFRIKDDGTARVLTWTTGASKAFRAVGVTLPTTTVIGKVVYVGCIYNADADRWDAVAVAQEA